jgi:hypothetical protein
MAEAGRVRRFGRLSPHANDAKPGFPANSQVAAIRERLSTVGQVTAWRRPANGQPPVKFDDSRPVCPGWATAPDMTVVAVRRSDRGRACEKPWEPVRPPTVSQLHASWLSLDATNGAALVHGRKLPPGSTMLESGPQRTVDPQLFEKSALVSRMLRVGCANNLRRATASMRANPSPNTLTVRASSAPGGSQKNTSRHWRGTPHVTVSPRHSRTKVSVCLSAEICASGTSTLMNDVAITG